MTSLSTLGAVDFKSAKERTASYAKAAAMQAKEQARLMRGQAAAARAVQRTASAAVPSSPAPIPPAPSPHSPPAGWYTDRDDSSMERSFDGTQWTEFTQPRQVQAPPALGRSAFLGLIGDDHRNWVATSR